MCGIAGIIPIKSEAFALRETLLSMSKTLKHRGPDGEGFLVLQNGIAKPYFHELAPTSSSKHFPYLPSEILPDSIQDAKLLFLHRRLAILDTGPGGHQPMCDPQSKIWLTYNGEIYNYLEIKKELEASGHLFYSNSDSEVLIAAYQKWGTRCVERFNGMWAFCLYDSEKQICFASRDRLGVKPFYFVQNDHVFAFASEQKALIRSGILRAKANAAAVAGYLLDGALEQEEQNFFEGITELMPGHQFIYDLRNHQFKLEKFYDLRNSFNLENDALDDRTLTQKVWEAFDQSVQLRLRSDVEVGTCLSGGIDSSALTVVMARHSMRPVHCFTSIFSNYEHNEEAFAESVVLKIRGIHHKVEPRLTEFQKDLNDLIYSQDVPIWSTSTYAQHRVMQLTHETGIKVVLDGQGADELFAGYHHHFIARWNQLLLEGKRSQVIKELLTTGKSIPLPLLFYFKEKLKSALHTFPSAPEKVLSKDFVKLRNSNHSAIYFDALNDQLADDINRTRLKIFLKCEDRAGMWHSVESRTPFSDDLPLINLAFSFNGARKIKGGVSKYFLREAVKPFLPEEVYNRYDKIGFETPMQKWMKVMHGQMLEEVEAANFSFLAQKKLTGLSASNTKDTNFLFKLFVLARWQSIFAA